MSKSSYYIIVTCIVTLLTSAVSFAAIDFDNSNFSPNFTNLLVNDNLTVNNTLSVRQINSIVGEKGEVSDTIIVNGLLDLSQPIFGTFQGDKLRITSNTEIAGNLNTNNIDSNSLTTIDVTLETLSSPDPNTPSIGINDIIDTNNRISQLRESGQNAVYKISTKNYTTDTPKSAYCAPGDMLLSCTNYESNLNVAFLSVIDGVKSGINGAIHNDSNTQGCVTYFVEKYNGLILSQYYPPGDINTYYSGVTALCLDLN